MPGGHLRICRILHAGGVPTVPAGHVFFGVSIFFCCSTHLLPVQVQPFFLQSVAGFDGSTHLLPFQVQPFFLQSIDIVSFNLTATATQSSGSR